MSNGVPSSRTIRAAAKRPDLLHAAPLHGDLPVWTVAAAVPDRPSPAAAAFLDLLRAR